MTDNNIREAIDHGKMTGFQVAVVSLCVMGNFIVGLSILVLPFTGPAISSEWGLSPEVFGTLLSSSLVGMMVGAFVLGPLADRYGRRGVLLFCMAAMTAGLFYSAAAENVETLMVARLISGLGIGGSLAGFNTLTSEYSSLRRRDLCIGLIISIGAVAGIVGGTVTAFLIDAYSWRAMYLLSGSLAVSVFPLMLAWLPESVDFLLLKRPGNALAKINRILRKMNLDTIQELPEIDRSVSDTVGFGKLISRPVIMKTLLMWISSLMVFTGFYFAISWAPKLLVDVGWDISLALYANVMMNVGGLVSGVAFGVMSNRFGHKVAIAVVLLGASVAFLLFGYAGHNQSLIYVLPLILGFFLFATVITQYAMLPRVYQPDIRNTGSGWALGIGKLAAIFGPFLAGLLLGRGWESFSLFYVFSIAYVSALIAVGGIWMLEKSK